MTDEEEDKSPGSRPPSQSEFAFIEHVRRRALYHSTSNTHHSSLALGIGDDAAVIRQEAGRDTVLTADLLVEEIDFRLSTTTPWLLGFKALAVSLSDIAAMGASPRFALLSIGVPAHIWNSDFVDRLYDGFFALAARYNVQLIGGDVSRTPERIVIDSIVIGETRRGGAIRRTGARPGDHIFVTGTLGGAAAGLHLLEHGARLSKKRPRAESQFAIEQLLLRQLRPEPRVRWGELLGKELLPTAMIDLSDGLSSDLSHLCHESGVGALIDAARLPFAPLVENLRGRRACDPLQLALNGGEDFELLFTIRPRDLRRLPRHIADVPATYLGDVTSEAGRIRVAAGSRVWTLRPAGFTHFGPG